MLDHPRLLVATAVVAAVAAPALADSTTLSIIAWNAVALALLAVSWVLMLVERAWHRDVEDSLTAIRLTAESASTLPRRAA